MQYKNNSKPELTNTIHASECNCYINTSNILATIYLILPTIATSTSLFIAKPRIMMELTPSPLPHFTIIMYSLTKFALHSPLP